MSLLPMSVNPTVLVVEDDPIAIKNMIRILQDEYELVIAKTLADARRLLQENVDAVLLDMHLGDGLGMELLDLIRAPGKHDDTPVMCVSAVSEDDIIEQAFLRGAADYIVKPCNPTILKSKLRMLVDWQRKTRLLERAAFSDPLTNIGNRRKFESLLEEEWRRASRQGLPLGLVLVDMDHFKEINDTWGHQRGDFCLKILSSVMEQTFERAGETVFRIGGDEFAALIPGAGLAQCLTIANLLKASVKKHCGGCQHRKISDCVGFSISAGCASVVPTDGEPPSSLFARADEALYAAKNQGGRNCVWPLGGTKGDLADFTSTFSSNAIEENPR